VGSSLLVVLAQYPPVEAIDLLKAIPTNISLQDEEQSGQI
jgi:hypothetical protein